MTIVLLVSPWMLIGDTEWPVPDPGPETFLLQRAAIMQYVPVPTPRGLAQALMFIPSNDLQVRKDAWAAWREPTREEQSAYTQFRAESSGLTLGTSLAK